MYAFNQFQCILLLLKFNGKKTKFMILSTPYRQRQSNFDQCSLRVGVESVSVSKCVRNLGTIVDHVLSMENNITAITRSVYCQLRNIQRLRRYLDPTSCARVVNSLVTTRLDFNNALLYGLPNNLLHRLQVVQNHAARLLSGTGRSKHVTPTSKSLAGY